MENKEGLVTLAASEKIVLLVRIVRTIVREKILIIWH